MQEKAHTDVVLADERQNAILHDAYRQINRPGFFDNLEAVYASCKQRGIPFTLIVLVTQHGPYRDLSEAEIRYEVFQALAYGSARMSYFTYWTPPHDDIWHWKNGMLTADGSRTQHYYDVQTVNRDLQPLGQALGGRTPDAVYHIGAEPDSLVRYWPGSHGSVAAISAEHLTISFFPDELLFLASKDYKAAQALTLTLRAGKTAQYYDTKESAWLPLASHDGTLTLTLAAGDAALLRFC